MFCVCRYRVANGDLAESLEVPIAVRGHYRIACLAGGNRAGKVAGAAIEGGIGNAFENDVIEADLRDYEAGNWCTDRGLDRQ